MQELTKMQKNKGAEKEEDVAKAIDILNASKKPVIIMGFGT